MPCILQLPGDSALYALSSWAGDLPVGHELRQHLLIPVLLLTKQWLLLEQQLLFKELL